MSTYIFNNDTTPHIYAGQEIQNGAYYQIQGNEALAFRQSETLLTDIASTIAIVSTEGNANGHLSPSAGLAQLFKNLVSVEQVDPDTGMVSISPKWAPAGWLQVYHEIEFKTSQIGSVHDKDKDNVDLGFTTLKFFDVNDVELTDQNVIDTDCVLTQIDFMPDHDYSIKSGQIAQIESPTSPLYVWAFAAPGIANTIFCEGGINLEYVGPKTLVGLDGTAASRLNYSHPQLGAGAGTNKIRFICRHNAGLKHRIQIIFEYFAA